jgi:hypothetical protein
LIRSWLIRVTQGASNCRDRDPGIAARGLDDAVARPKVPAGVTLLQDEESHPVLDAAGHVDVFGLGVDHAPSAAEGHVDSEQRCVADEAFEAANPPLDCPTFFGHGSSVPLPSPQVNSANGP